MPVGDATDIANRACRLARRDPTISAQFTLALEAVNEGYLETLASSDDWEFLRAEGTVTLASNTDTRTYDQFATDLALGTTTIEEILDFADDTDGWVLEALSWSALERLVLTSQSFTVQSAPRWWAQTAYRTCRFYPRPSQATTLRIYYRIKDAALGAAGVPLIPSGFAAPLLEHYGAFKLLTQDSGWEADNEAQTHRAIYEDKLAKLKRAYATARSPIIGLIEPGAFYDLPDELPGYYQY